MDNREPETDPAAQKEHKSRLVKWFKRVGVAGFLFFLFKGLAWLFFGNVIIQYFGCKG